MNEDAARDDIAFIRRTMEQGRRVVGAWSPDVLVWGIAIAIGYFGTYGRVRGYSTIDPVWLWLACILLPWAYTLRRLPARLVARGPDTLAPNVGLLRRSPCSGSPAAFSSQSWALRPFSRANETHGGSIQPLPA